MADAGPSVCAEIVQRDDPEFFRAAMCAREPARTRLMILGAYDIELSRASGQTTGARHATGEEGALIARMRLQFWRDAVLAVEAGEALPVHDVASALQSFAESRLLPVLPALLALIEAREMELEAPFDRTAFEAWADRRFGEFVWAATQLCGVRGARARTAARETGVGLGAAFVLRNAVSMARQGLPPLVPDLSASETAALAEGRSSPDLQERAIALATFGIESIAGARRLRSGVPRRATPAFLGLARAEATLRRVRRHRGTLSDGSHEPARPMQAAAHALRTLTGRW